MTDPTTIAVWDAFNSPTGLSVCAVNEHPNRDVVVTPIQREGDGYVKASGATHRVFTRAGAKRLAKALVAAADVGKTDEELAAELESSEKIYGPGGPKRYTDG
jgi:hypothetical protein